MSGILLTGTDEQIEAFEREDPKFCQFLKETGRLVQKDERKGEQHEKDNRKP